MRPSYLLLLLALIRAAFIPAAGSIYGGDSQQSTAVTIRADGTCHIRSESSMTRASAERWLLNWERYSARNAVDDLNPGTDAEPAEPGELKPLSDAELAEKFRAMSEKQWSEMDSEFSPHIEKVEVTKDQVTTVLTNQFATIQNLLDDGRIALGQAGFEFDRLKFEKNAEGQLQVTFFNEDGNSIYGKRAIKDRKSAHFKAEQRLVLPGKIIRSDFPAFQDNATWVSIDWEKDDTLQAAFKFHSLTQAVVVAELGGLKLDQPIESTSAAKLYGRARQSKSDKPVEAASPGFVAEAQSLTLTTVHKFPNVAEKKSEGMAFDPSGNPGVEIQVKIFPPKGKTIRATEGVKVLRAVDDQNNELKPPKGPSDEEIEMRSYMGGSRDEAATSIQLSLALPKPEAQSIEEVSAEAVLTTVSQWREMALTNIQAGATNEIDLGAIVEGARFSVTKATGRRGSWSVLATVTGPPAINDIDFSAPESTGDRSQTFVHDMQTTTKANGAVRRLNITAYDFGQGGRSASTNLTLRARLPLDLRRERFQFKLGPLDLL